MNKFEVKISIEGIKELTAAVQALAGTGVGAGQVPPALSGLAGAGMEGGQAASAPTAQQATVSVQQPAAPTQQAAMPAQQMAAPMQQPAQPWNMQQPAQPWNMPVPGAAPQNYGQPPQQPGMPAGAAMHPPVNQAGLTSTVPTTAMPQEFTIEQLQVAAAGLSSMGRMPQVLGILQQFGIQAMTELPKERYGEFAIALREAGAQI